LQPGGTCTPPVTHHSRDGRFSKAGLRSAVPQVRAPFQDNPHAFSGLSLTWVETKTPKHKPKLRLLELTRLQRDGRNSGTALGFTPNQFNSYRSCSAPGLDCSKTILNSNLVPVVSEGPHWKEELKTRCASVTARRKWHLVDAFALQENPCESSDNCSQERHRAPAWKYPTACTAKSQSSSFSVGLQLTRPHAATAQLGG